MQLKALEVNLHQTLIFHFKRLFLKGKRFDSVFGESTFMSKDIPLRKERRDLMPTYGCKVLPIPSK
jgi:hypothetical protein